MQTEVFSVFASVDLGGEKRRLEIHLGFQANSDRLKFQGDISQTGTIESFLFYYYHYLFIPVVSLRVWNHRLD